MPFSKRNWTSAGPTLPDPLSSPANPQDQSPLFETLPIEIRRHIYKQLWLDCGLTQHILALTPKAYLQSYPCVLSQEELDQEPVPAIPGDSDEADDSEAGPDANDEQEEPQPHEEPGDINGALYDLGGDYSSADRESPNTPWCAHHACFRRWSQRYGHSFSSMYSAGYRSDRGRPDLRASVVLTAFLVCRRVYQEAGESLYSSVRFSFSSLVAMKIFVSQVPRPLMCRIQFADIVAANLGIFPIDNRTSVQQVYEILRQSSPNLRELRLALHPGHGSRVIPGKHDLEPLCALARSMDTRLSRFEVFLPTRCEGKTDLGYGGAPLSLRDGMPFTVKVVPPGFHEADDCAPFDWPARSLQDWMLTGGGLEARRIPWDVLPN